MNISIKTHFNLNSATKLRIIPPNDHRPGWSIQYSSFYTVGTLKAPNGEPLIFFDEETAFLFCRYWRPDIEPEF